MNINDVLSDPILREQLLAYFIKEEGLLRYKGDVFLKLSGPDGRIKAERVVNNLVVNTGLYHIIDQLTTTPDEAGMGYIAIGDNNTAPASGDTVLANELGRVAITSKTQGSGGNANQLTYTATIPAGTGTGTIVEAGIFNASSGGIMLARSIFSPISKGAGDSLGISWVLSASAS